MSEDEKLSQSDPLFEMEIEMDTEIKSKPPIHCRICLDIDEEMFKISELVKILVGLVNTPKITAFELFENITGISISESDGILQYLCRKCFNSLKEVFTIQLLAKESEDKLKNQCRICMTCDSDVKQNFDDIIQMDEGDSKYVYDLFEKGTGLSASDNVKLTNLICQRCINRLIESIRFREQTFKQTAVIYQNVFIKIPQTGSENKEIENNDGNETNFSDGNSLENSSVLEERNEDEQTWYSCEICSKGFSTEGKLSQHMQTDHTKKQGTHQCKICFKQYKFDYNLRRHVMLAHSNGIHYDCSVCGKSFSKRAALRSHKHTDHPDEPSVCKVCSKSFNNARDLGRHRRTHHRRTIICHVCAKTFNSTSNLKSHMRSHSDERPYVCEICSKGYVSSQILKNHMKLHTGERPFKCNVCSKQFPTASALGNHKKTHTDARPYACKICPKAFKDMVNLKRHMRGHTGERPFECPECLMSFTQKVVLNAHMVTHSTQKPFPCEVCPREFSRKTSLNIHMRIHNNDRPFVCEICNKGFTMARDCKEHVETHSDERKYICEACKKGFKTARYLRHHKKRCSGVEEKKTCQEIEATENIST